MTPKEAMQGWLRASRPSSKMSLQEELSEEQKAEVRQVAADRQLELRDRLSMLKSMDMDDNELKQILITHHENLIESYEKLLS